MLRILLVLAATVLVAMAIVPDAIAALTWVLAFFSLLIAGDLGLALIRKFRLRLTARRDGKVASRVPSHLSR